MTNYKEIFEKVESSLKNYSTLSESEFEDVYGRFKLFENIELRDDEYFQKLIMIIFYSGFRSTTVTNKGNVILGHFPNYRIVAEYTEEDFKRIFSDSDMIKNSKKIQSCINNAKTFREIIAKHDSFQKYIESFNANDSLENLLLLKEELEYRFNFLGGTTVFHFLTDMGFNVLKPDRVILRIFERLGLIENRKQFFKAIIQGRLFSKTTGIPIRYIDIIFVRYGQQGENQEFGLKDGICLESNPKCKEECDIKEYCNHYRNK